MGRWLVAILLVVVGATGGYVASESLDDDVASTVAESPTSESREWLFVMTAGSGSLDETKLELTEVHHKVTAFTDRPVRDSAVVEVERFLGLWKEGKEFAEDPPNAGLEMITDGGKRQIVTLELPSVERSGETLTFEVAELGDQNVTGSFDEATLFLDNVPLYNLIYPPDEGSGGQGQIPQGRASCIGFCQ